MMLLTISDYTNGCMIIVPIPTDIEEYLTTNFKGCNIDWFTTDNIKIDPSCNKEAIKYESINL